MTDEIIKTASVDPLISIIVPAYNAENTLDYCLESVTRQTYHNLEIIIIDDGSTDHTVSLCDDWAKADSRIQVVHQANTGVAGARNVGLEVATGDLLTWVDSDDWIDETYIKALYAEQRISDSDMVVDFPESSVASRESIEYKGDMVVRQHILGRLGFSLWGTLAKTSLLRNLSFHSYAIGEDAEFLLRVRSQCQTVKLVNLGGYHYVHREDSAVHRFDISSIHDWMRSWHDEEMFIGRYHLSQLPCIHYAWIYVLLLIARQIDSSGRCDGDVKELRTVLRKKAWYHLKRVPWLLLTFSEKKEVIAMAKYCLKDSIVNIF